MLLALLARASVREPMKTADSLSGARFERVVVDGERYVLKHLNPLGDWLLRASGDAGCRAVALDEVGLYAALPPSLDPAVVATGRGPGRYDAAVLMHDVAEFLIPPGDGPVGMRTHRRMLDVMAEQHAAFWGWRDGHGFVPMATRYTLLSPLTARTEPDTPGVPRLLGPMWRALLDGDPDVARVVAPLLDDPWPLVEALADTPSTFVHGDWKFGNLGIRPDGTVILLDWDRPGAGPPAFDLTWYLAVNCDRLPETKEAAIDAYRGALESHGVDTSGWWERQLSLCLLGAFLQLGWSKSGDELAWWRPHVLGAEL